MTSDFGPRTSDVFVIPDSAALHSGYDTATRISLQRPLNLLVIHQGEVYWVLFSGDGLELWGRRHALVLQ